MTANNNKVQTYLKEYNTADLDLRILSPSEATVYTLKDSGKV